MLSILLIETDPSTLTVLTNTLQHQGYAVGTALNFQEGLARAENYDLILLNPNIVDGGNSHPCQALRLKGYQKPILLLLEDASRDGIAGLDAGADDYAVKPFKLPDLLAHIRALLRRQDSRAPTTLLRWGELVVNPSSAEVTYRAILLALTPKEFRLLELFLRNPQRVFSRMAILDHIWGFTTVSHESTVTNHIKELRQKLKAVGLPVDIIETIYGLGYRLKSPPSTEVSLESPVQPQSFHSLPVPVESHVVNPRVLVVADDATIGSALQYLLQPWGFQVSISDDPNSIWMTLANVLPDLLILDLDLSYINGIDLCRRVRQHEKWGDLLILVMTSDTSVEAIQWAFVAGADDFVSKPIVGPELVTRVASRLEQRRPQPGWVAEMVPEFQPGVEPGNIQNTYGNILLVDDQPENLQTLSKILSRQGYRVRKALRGRTALEAVHSQKPDLIVLDVRMPEMNGYEVCAALKANADTRNIPVLFLSALDDTADKLKAFAVGGVDYITKPFQAEEVLARIKHQIIILNQKRQLAARNHQLQREIQERQQSQITLEQLQETLQESEVRFQCLFEQAPIALAIMSVDDRWLQVNPVLCTLLSSSRVELLNQPVSRCLQVIEPALGGLEWGQQLLQAWQAGYTELLCQSQLGHPLQLRLKVWPVGDRQQLSSSCIAQFEPLTD